MGIDNKLNNYRLADKPLVSLMRLDMLDRNYDNIHQLPDMIQTLTDKESLRFTKVGLSWDTTAQLTHYPSSTPARKDLEALIKVRVKEEVARVAAYTTDQAFIVGDEVAAEIARKLYIRMSLHRKCGISVDSPDEPWAGYVHIKPGVTIQFSPCQNHRHLLAGRKDVMSGWVSQFAGRKVYWVLRSQVGDVTNYFTDEQMFGVWRYEVVEAFPFIQPPLGDVDFLVHRG